MVMHIQCDSLNEVHQWFIQYFESESLVDYI